MSIKLYYCPGAASLCVHWMMIEMGMEFQTVLVDLSKKEQKNQEYLSVNPLGKVPALEMNGKIYTESVAILLKLSDQCERMKPVVGSDEHSKWIELMVYFSSTLMPPFYDWFYADALSKGSKEVEEFLKDHAYQRVSAVFNRIESILSDGRTYLLGEQLRSVDFLGTMLMRWSRYMPKTALDWPYINKYIHKMRKLPSFTELYKKEGLTEWQN